MKIFFYIKNIANFFWYAVEVACVTATVIVVIGLALWAASGFQRTA